MRTPLALALCLLVAAPLWSVDKRPRRGLGPGADLQNQPEGPIHMVADSSRGDIHINWNQPNREPSDSVIIIYSQTDGQLSYPRNAVIQRLPGLGHTNTVLTVRELVRDHVSPDAPLYLRVIFLRQGDHEARRRPHVAESNTFMLSRGLMTELLGHYDQDPISIVNYVSWNLQPPTRNVVATKPRLANPDPDRMHNQQPQQLWQVPTPEIKPETVKKATQIPVYVPPHLRGDPMADQIADDIAQLTERKWAIEKALENIAAVTDR